MTGEDAAPAITDLPAPVRTKVLALVAESLPEVVPLPASLRKVAAFAPARRARLGGRAIATALADDDFRQRAATQVRARRPEQAAGREDLRAGGVQTSEADPTELAAHCWLQRPDGWEALLPDLLHEVERSRAPAVPGEEELARMGERLAAAEQSVRETRAEHRARLAQLKEENTDLRRKLGETRSALRRAREESEEAATAREAARSAAEHTARQSESEVRRLRAQLEQLTRDLQAARRESRTGRDEATVRARLLLDTVVEAASGLRRELALPNVEGVPADAVEVVEAESGTPTPGSAGALGPRSPALLEKLLALPRARLLVDGYNVSKTAWASSPLEAQRIRLLSALTPLVARTGAETTVVFDAHGTDSRPVVNAPRGVRVVFSPVGVIADDVLRDYVRAEPGGRVVVVVTSDRALAADLRRGGAHVVAAEALLGLFSR